MCWYVYIATPKPLTGVLFTGDLPPGLQPAPLHFREILDEADEAQLYRPLFTGRHLYYVGSETGCSCALDYYTDTWREEEAERETPSSPRAFIEFIRSYLQNEDTLQMYALWEDDRRSLPLESIEIDFHELSMETYFGLHSRLFYTFLTNRATSR